MDVDVDPCLSPVHILVVESLNYVQLDVIKFNYTWSCADIMSLIVGDECELTSPMFSYGVNDEPKFCLTFCVGGEDSNGDNYYSVYLKLISSHTKEVEAKYKFAFININGEKVNEKDSKGTRFFEPGCFHGRNRFLKCELFPNFDFLFINNTFRIFCEVTVYQNSELFKASNSSLSDDLHHLFENEEFSDVTLSVNGNEHNVHRNILAARSPVFAAMFKTDMEESRTGKVTITDIDNDVIKEMLRFIYTGRSLLFDRMAEELLVAADRYQLETLKGECQEALRKSLSIANAPKLLVLADVLHADRLKARTIDFITTHASAVMETAAFQSMFNTHPKLISEAFRALATKSMPNMANS